MKRKAKDLSKRAAQIEGALALFGGGNKVIAYEASFTHRAGELIARAAATEKSPQRKPGHEKRPTDAPRLLSGSAQRDRDGRT